MSSLRCTYDTLYYTCIYICTVLVSHNDVHTRSIAWERGVYIHNPGMRSSTVCCAPSIVAVLWSPRYLKRCKQFNVLTNKTHIASSPNKCVYYYLRLDQSKLKAHMRDIDKVWFILPALELVPLEPQVDSNKWDNFDKKDECSFSLLPAAWTVKGEQP